MLTSTTRDGAREEVGLSPAVDYGLVVDVLDHTVRSTGKLHLEKQNPSTRLLFSQTFI